MNKFSRDWLKLRESADLAARDPTLARRFAAALPRGTERPLRLVDLGAGSGANCRALSPRIARDQDWTLVERDPDLMAAQSEEFTFWARRQGYPILAGGGRITISVGDTRWTVRNELVDLADDLSALEAIGADGITAAAFFDLVSAGWLDKFATMLADWRVPFLTALTVDGRRDWDPQLEEDAQLRAAFRQHQTRDKGFGPALGGAAVRHLASALATTGFAVTEAISDWRLGASDHDLIAELICSETGAAREAGADGRLVANWERQRHEQLVNGKLKLTIGHRDLLALPS
jgi:hypothetical protein